MRRKYEQQVHRDLARDLKLMIYEDTSRSSLISKLGGKCRICNSDDSSVLEVTVPKGLKAPNFKDKLRWVSLPGFSLICGNCRVRSNVEARKKKISETTKILTDQWKKENEQT